MPLHDHCPREGGADATARGGAGAAAQLTVDELLQGLPVAVAGICDDGRLMLWNPAAERLSGWTAAEMLGQPVSRCLPEWTPDLASDTVLWLCRADGRKCPVQVSRAGLTYRDPRCSGTLVCLTDVSQLAQQAEALREAMRRAEAAAAAKSAFLAHMSHEIRTPMHGILGSLELLLDDEGLSVEQAEHLHTAYASGQTLLELLNDILDFSKLEAEALQISPGPCPLQDLLYDVASLFRSRLEPDVELLVRCDPQLPPRIIADGVRLRQVLANLIGNACKFTHAGHILVEAAGGGDRLRLAVSDTGIGIPAAFLPCLFEPFSQAHSGPTRRYGGTGLGLAICRRLVERMGGRILVDSVEGAGSTFTVELPLLADPGSGPKAERRCHGVRVLVADAYELHASILVRQLDAAGAVAHDVHAWSEVAERLTAAQAASAPYDAVIVDRRLLGPDLARAGELRALAARSPLAVILCTRDSHPGDQARCLAQGIHGYLVRPVRPERLVSVVSEAIRLARSGERALASRVSHIGITPVRRQRLPRRARVLLAEDHPVIRQVTTLMLEKLGVAVVSVVDGAAAQVRRFADPVDLVLMDVHMPEVDGLQATQGIRARELAEGWPRIPIIAMTADATHEDRAQCLAAGMDDHLAKPASLEALDAVLLRWLPQRG